MQMDCAAKIYQNANGFGSSASRLEATWTAALPTFNCIVPTEPIT
jgi:hypothetical protein